MQAGQNKLHVPTYKWGWISQIHGAHAQIWLEFIFDYDDQ